MDKKRKEEEVLELTADEIDEFVFENTACKRRV